MGVLRYGSQQYVLDLYRTGMPARKDRPARYGAGPCARGGCVCAETANRLIAAAHPYSAISALPCGSATCGGRRLRRGAPTGRRGRRKIVRSAARCQSYPCAAGPRAAKRYRSDILMGARRRSSLEARSDRRLVARRSVGRSIRPPVNPAPNARVFGKPARSCLPEFRPPASPLRQVPRPGRHRGLGPRRRRSYRASGR